MGNSLFDDDALWHLDGAGGDGTQTDAGKADGADAGKPAVPRLAAADAAKLTEWGAVSYMAGRGVKERLADYEGYLARMKARSEDAPKTTDDTFTPAPVYAAVLDWLAARADIGGRRIVRPFYPGGDFEAFPYAEGDVVVDNPPFSLLARVVRFYRMRGIEFFLFAPALTCLDALKQGSGLCAVVTGENAVFENGAKIHIGFLTSLFPGTRVIVSPSLAAALRMADTPAAPPKKLARYSYPDTVWNGAMLGTVAANMAAAGMEEDIPIPEAASRFTSYLDQQRLYKKGLYGGGVLTGRRTGARLAKAAKAAKAAKTVCWQLSEEETAIVDALSRAEEEMQTIQDTAYKTYTTNITNLHTQ